MKMFPMFSSFPQFPSVFQPTLEDWFLFYSFPPPLRGENYKTQSNNIILNHIKRGPFECIGTISPLFLKRITAKAQTTAVINASDSPRYGIGVSSGFILIATRHSLPFRGIRQTGKWADPSPGTLITKKIQFKIPYSCYNLSACANRSEQQEESHDASTTLPHPAALPAYTLRPGRARPRRIGAAYPPIR